MNLKDPLEYEARGNTDVKLEYPSDWEYEKIVREYIKHKKMQNYLQDEFGLCVCTNKTDVISDISRKFLFGYDDFKYLHREALASDTTTKSSAFKVETNLSHKELVSDLKETKRRAKEYGDKNVQVRDVDEDGDNIELELDYIVEKKGQIQAFAQQAKTATLEIEDTDKELSTVKQEYDKVDKETAVSEFLEEWNSEREEEDKEIIERKDIALSELSLANKVNLVRDIINCNTDNWTRKNVEGVNAIRDETVGEIEDEDDVDEMLEGIEDAAVSGKRLDTNEFVNKCEDNGFYFDQVEIRYEHKRKAKQVVVDVEFKGRRNTFEVSVSKEYEEIDDSMSKTDFSIKERQSIRSEFREKVMELFDEYAQGESDEKQKASA